MRNLVIMPNAAQRRESLNLGEFAEEATVIQDEMAAKSGVSFLEANTDEITMNELTGKSIVICP